MGSAVALVILARALGPLPKPIPDSEPEEGSELPEHLLNIQIPVGSGIPDTLCVMPNKTQELGPEDFSEVTQQLGLDTTHKETRFVTKKRQP